MITSKEIRQSFLDFFASKQHTIVPSASLLPDSPNLLFTNAGMNQFVPIFLGQVKPHWTPPRATDTQKCIRAGGKHNDLEDVGLDTYHHTFFEMLGNWSFGDYFKREAIDWAWELLTERWHFPKERLYATHFGGDDKTAADTESRDSWLRYLPADHLVPGNRKDNFWMMGDTGPCGPCSEIHVDLTPAGDGGAKLVNSGSPQCIEIWNLVFIQFNALPDGTFVPLPAKHVDTGMGFERVCSMIQCTNGFKDFTRRVSNYDTDVFSPIFRELEKLSGKKYGSTLPGSQAGTTALSAKDTNESSGGTGVPASADVPPRGIVAFNATRRNLPHWQEPGSVYFITFRTHMSQTLSEPMRDVVLDACRHWHGQKYHLYAVTVMPDHVHLLIWPRPLDASSSQAVIERGFHGLSEVLHSIKSFTAHEIQARFNWKGSVWQDESFDRIVRDDREFSEKWDYLANNAAKKQLAHSAEEYRWFWFATEPPTTQAETPVPPEQIQTDIGFRVIADHVRCLSFAVADGIAPSNEGRGYVLRRILRRAVRYGRNLGLHEPFFYKLVDDVAENFGAVFPDVKYNADRVRATLRAEEESFNKTLDRGLEIFEEVVAQLSTQQAGTPVPPKPISELPVAQASLPVQKVFPATEAFKLYDTFGFPLDLTELMARERGLTVDVTGFETLMEEQRRRAREDYDKKKATITVSSDGLNVEPTKFLGYDNLEAEAVIEAVEPGAEGIFEIVMDQTPFYAEMGGQVGDTGLVHVPGHDRDEIGRLTVLDTQKKGDVHVHKCRLLPRPQAGTPVPPKQRGLVEQASVPVGIWRTPEVGEAVRVAVDAARRANIQRHHTVTHLFHWALHEVVSKDARQRGSLVAPDRLRFDFNHGEGLTDAQIADIERLVNERVRESATVAWFELPYNEIKGNPKVMQFFGDKYGSIVRVVQIGGQAGNLDGYSMELCGGTHTRTTGAIGLFKITKESAIAAGVRRIEAVCGQFALEFIEQLKRQAQVDADREKARERQKDEDKRQKSEARSQAATLAEQLLGRARPPGAPLVSEIPNADAELLRAVVDALKPKLASGIVVLGAVEAQAETPVPPVLQKGAVVGQASVPVGKVHLICYVTPDLVKAGKHAGKIVGELAKICGGGGGGKPDLAQAGGKQPEKLSEALASVSRLIAT